MMFVVRDSEKVRCFTMFPREFAVPLDGLEIQVRIGHSFGNVSGLEQSQSIARTTTRKSNKYEGAPRDCQVIVECK